MTDVDPAHALDDALESIAKRNGALIALQMAEAMIAAGTVALIRERGWRYAYARVSEFSDDIALQIIAHNADYCGNGE